MHMEKTGWVCLSTNLLTQWGQVKHICVGKLTIIGSDNGLTPGCCQAINWTNAGNCQLDPSGQTSVKFQLEFKYFRSRKCIWKCRLQNGAHFLPPQFVNKQNICEMYYTPVKATPGVSWGPIEGLWGPQKYPGQPDTSATIICWTQAHWNKHLSISHTEQSEQ